MSKPIKVVSFGPGSSVPGGITRVIELIGTHLSPNIESQHVPTFTHYTGDPEAGQAALEIRNRGLQRIARRIGGARIFIALVHAWARLHVGGSCIDRRHDGARQGVGPLPAVNDARRERVLGVLVAHALKPATQPVQKIDAGHEPEEVFAVHHDRDHAAVEDVHEACDRGVGGHRDEAAHHRLGDGLIEMLRI